MSNKANIGIGITTHNRYDVFSKTYKEMNKYLPANCRLVVVDDGSIDPVKEATFRFDKNVGIATAKNKCLELLEDCEHIFLFDDDTYPRCKDWHKPYIEAGEPHLMYLFKDFVNQKINDSVDVYDDGKIKALSHPRGCMLYVHNSVLKVAGGMDISYERWGFEHGDYSNRIYNLGMTSFRFADVVGSDKLIFSMDENQCVKTTVRYEERKVCIKKTEAKYNNSFKSKQFKEYKNYTSKKVDPARSVVIATYLNAMPDVQRKGKIWSANYDAVRPLVKSAEKLDVELVILHNCFKEKDTKNIKHVWVDQALNPYFQRWLSEWRYLRDHPEIQNCFLVDATDVEILKNPFFEIEDGILYSGDEKDRVWNRWMQISTKKVEMQEYFFNHREYFLLNCGVVGGSREVVMSLLRDMCDYYFTSCHEETIDMPIYNYVAYTKYHNIIDHGRKVTSLFKGYEQNSKAWFKHK